MEAEFTEDDLYVAANEVIVEGTIGGDLVAVGNSITVDGTVEGDLIAAGQSVEVGARWTTTCASPVRPCC